MATLLYLLQCAGVGVVLIAGFVVGLGIAARLAAPWWKPWADAADWESQAMAERRAAREMLYAALSWRRRYRAVLLNTGLTPEIVDDRLESEAEVIGVEVEDEMRRWERDRMAMTFADVAAVMAETIETPSPSR